MNDNRLAPIESIQSVESEHPWLWLLYAVAAVAACAIPLFVEWWRLFT